MSTPGLEVLEEQVGSGPAARSGDRVSYDLRIFLNRGDEVAMGKGVSETVLGKRRVIAGIEKSLIGMRAGGYRKVRISPHLAYGDAGVADAIPPAAVLCVELWLREIMPP
jgi:FKBP-type peptidyl-prolyl cis-trans isomerase